jgi:hypothetical protein
MSSLRNVVSSVVLFCAAVLAISALTATPSGAASVPAWLDDSITSWNKENPTSPIRFVDIKDSYVWYTLAATPELDSKTIRSRVYDIAYRNGYKNTQDEELVTTGKPPTSSGPSKAKKCWTRSFLRDLQQGSATTQERMLTTLVCEDGASWSAGFRILQ